MQNLASLVLFFAAGFIFALSTAWLFVRITLHLRKQLYPPAGSILRLRASSGIYRSHLVSLSDTVWKISAPIQRDAYVPLRVGETLVIEAASTKGALIFRSEVVARDIEEHMLIIQKPARVHHVERRGHRRWPQLAGASAKLEGHDARIVDLSEGGARIETGLNTYKGDRVRLDLPTGQEVFAWVIARDGNEARLRFEELLDMKLDKKETAPAL